LPSISTMILSNQLFSNKKYSEIEEAALEVRPFLRHPPSPRSTLYTHLLI